MSGDYTILVAVAAGLISFLSPCVLPLVPAYLGQLTALAVVSQEGGTPSRWTAVRHALAYVLGFGAVFTLLGITAAFAGGVMADYIKPLRVIGWRRAGHHGLQPRGAASDPSAGANLAPARRGRLGGDHVDDRRDEPRACRWQRGRWRRGPGRTAAARWPCRLRSRVRTRSRVRRRLDAMHRCDPGRHPDDGRDVRHAAPGRAPAGRLHGRAGDPVPSHRRLLRSNDPPDACPRATRPDRVADRRSARGRDRAGDDLRPAWSCSRGTSSSRRSYDGRGDARARSRTACRPARDPAGSSGRSAAGSCSRWWW